MKECNHLDSGLCPLCTDEVRKEIEGLEASIEYRNKEIIRLSKMLLDSRPTRKQIDVLLDHHAKLLAQSIRLFSRGDSTAALESMRAEEERLIRKILGEMK